MNLQLKFSLAIALILCIYFQGTVYGQDFKDDQQLKTAMRMIGHEVLLCVGDNTSRVLPIEKDNFSYRIPFESQFEFGPEDLSSTIDYVMSKYNISNHYIIEVEEMDSKEIVYNYLIQPMPMENLLPCVARNLPKKKYDLLITILDQKENQQYSKVEHDSDKVTPFNKYGFPLLAILSIGIFTFSYLHKRKLNKPLDENTIAIGSYLFDKHNMELKYNNGITIELTSKEADLLIVLYESSNKTVERDTILSRVWGDEGDYVGRTLDVFISKLRKKLEFDTNIKIINTRGVGYKLVISN